jgi:hypothetical protein
MHNNGKYSQNRLFQKTVTFYTDVRKKSMDLFDNSVSCHGLKFQNKSGTELKGVTMPDIGVVPVRRGWKKYKGNPVFFYITL